MIVWRSERPGRRGERPFAAAKMVTFMKKTTAQKKEKQLNRKTEGKRRVRALLPWISSAVLGALAYFLKFVAPGYGFSAMVCCGIIALILFYTVTAGIPVAWVQSFRKIVTVCLVIGLIAAGITEYFIIRASFGDPDEHCDYIVVLGAKVRESGPSVSLWDRIYGAYDYLQAHPEVTAVVSGGQGTDEPMTEAQAMYEELVKLGVDPQRIWIEEKATSTWENLTFSLDLIEEKTGTRPEKLGIVSSEYHLFRAGMFAKKCGVEAVGIPAQTSRFSQKVNHFMREIAGIWHYFVLGGNYDA